MFVLNRAICDCQEPWLVSSGYILFTAQPIPNGEAATLQPSAAYPGMPYSGVGKLPNPALPFASATSQPLYLSLPVSISLFAPGSVY